VSKVAMKASSLPFYVRSWARGVLGKSDEAVEPTTEVSSPLVSTAMP
jgi:hypothetical protein